MRNPIALSLASILPQIPLALVNPLPQQEPPGTGIDYSTHKKTIASPLEKYDRLTI